MKFTLIIGLFAVTAAAVEPFEPFLEKYCIHCHGPDKEKGNLRIDQLSRDFKVGADGHLWAEVVERINAGEMPPDDEPQPSEAEIASVIRLLDDKISEGRAARMAARPPVAHYRLSRKEYQNTAYDLLGVRYDPTRPGELNADPLWHGFERIGSQLTLSPSHVDRYYRAAQTVLARAFPSQPVEASKIRKTAAEIRYRGGYGQRKYLKRFGIKRPLRALIFPGRLQTALKPEWFGKDVGPGHSGLYRARMQVSGIRPPDGQIAHLRIGKRLGEATNEGLVELDILAPEDEPEIIEFEVFLEMPATLYFNVVATNTITGPNGRNSLNSNDYIFTHTSETHLLNPRAPRMFHDNGQGIFSFVLLDWIEWEGPLTSEPERATRKDLLPGEMATKEQVSNYLQNFTERAWRRPVAIEELAPYLQAYDLERAAGESVHDAYQVALLGVLTSRNFTYLVEGNVEPRERLTDFELASRLSYFLWSSMPDQALIDTANKGKLTNDQTTLKHQVDRMLTDAKFQRFIEDFPRQWLQLHRLGMFPPDKKLYPDYDAWLEASMRQEVLQYFRETLEGNHPIETLLTSDWTMANPRLCDFYGLPEPTKSGFQRVSLLPEHHRGGLLTMGAILGLTSDGTRHRPVHRGVWLSEAIFGRTPPSPPANVDPIEPNPSNLPKATVRQKLKAHTTHASCAACHKTIDPLGLAFDEYDAIGQWRTHERVQKGKGSDPPVDASGKLPDGRNFANAHEFKQLLREDRDRFLQAFVEHLCTYALRRVLTIDDKNDVMKIVEEAKRNGYRLQDIIRTVAVSDILQKR